MPRDRSDSRIAEEARCVVSSSRSCSTRSCSRSSCSSSVRSRSPSRSRSAGTAKCPSSRLRGAGPIGFLSWAAILVLVNRFARPVLVALTGRLLFSTLGLFIVIINAIAIWLTSLIAPIKIGIVAEPGLPVDHRRRQPCTPGCRPSWTRSSASIGRRSARTTAAGSGASSSRCRRRDATRIIENLRLQQVYSAIYTTSLDIALEDTPVGAFRRWFDRVVIGNKVSARQRDRVRSGSATCSSDSDRPT